MDEDDALYVRLAVLEVESRRIFAEKAPLRSVEPRFQLPALTMADAGPLWSSEHSDGPFTVHAGTPVALLRLAPRTGELTLTVRAAGLAAVPRLQLGLDGAMGEVTVHPTGGREAVFKARFARGPDGTGGRALDGDTGEEPCAIHVALAPPEGGEDAGPEATVFDVELVADGR